jgi:predicted MFS family arabinose efflux permease
MALLPRIVESHYHRGVGSYGLLFSLMACGMVLGSLAWARWHPRRHRIAICFSAFGMGAAGIVAVGLSPWYWPAALAVVWRGFWIGVGGSSWTTLVLEFVPDRLLSCVWSLDWFGSTGLRPIGYALAAVLSNAIAPTTILVIGGSVAVSLWCCTPLLWRPVRTGATR